MSKLGVLPRGHNGFAYVPEPGIGAAEYRVAEGLTTRPGHLLLLRREGQEQPLTEHRHTSLLTQIKANKESGIVILQIRKQYSEKQRMHPINSKVGPGSWTC